VDERRVHELGISGTLPKPFTRGRLSQVVAHALRERAAHTGDATRGALPEA